MRSLVVDPSIIAQRMTSNVLRETGCDEVVFAAGMTQALEHWDGETADPIDLVITEWDLAEGDGLELVKSIRQKSKGSHLSIVMQTARNSREDVLEAIRAGVDGYVLKPIGRETLKARIDRETDRIQQSRASGSETESETETESTSGSESESEKEAA